MTLVPDCVVTTAIYCIVLYSFNAGLMPPSIPCISFIAVCVMLGSLSRIVVGDSRACLFGDDDGDGHGDDEDGPDNDDESGEEIDSPSMRHKILHLYRSLKPWKEGGKTTPQHPWMSSQAVPLNTRPSIHGCSLQAPAISSAEKSH